MDCKYNDSLFSWEQGMGGQRKLEQDFAQRRDNRDTGQGQKKKKQKDTVAGPQGRAVGGQMPPGLFRSPSSWAFLPRLWPLPKVTGNPRIPGHLRGGSCPQSLRPQ